MSKTRSTTRSRGSVGELAGVGIRSTNVREDARISELSNFRMMGQGEYAVVYAAKWRDHPDGEVAVKVLKKEYLGSDGPAEDMRAEAQILSKLNNNPGTVNIFASGDTEDGRPFFIMEKLSGTTLGPRIRRVTDYLKRLEMLTSLARIFETLHSGVATDGKKVLHRDVKPNNIGVTPSTGDLRLLDFGLVRLLHEGEVRCWGKGLLDYWSKTGYPTTNATRSLAHCRRNFSPKTPPPIHRPPSHLCRP